jgi:hypothetical protein
MITAYYSLATIFLVPPCLVYFYELFMTVNLRSITNQPAFWIVTGLFFLNACNVPLMMTAAYLENYFDAAYSLNYILFGIFFILLIRAYLCTPDKPTHYETFL